MLDRLGLTSAAHTGLGEYSRGMLQRLTISQALLHQPDFLFLDEPTSALDPNGVLLVRDLIDEQKKRGALVLLASHQLAEVEKVCDRVLFLKGGLIATIETLRGLEGYVVEIRMVAGSFDASTVEQIAGSAPIEDTVIVPAATERDVAAIIRRLVNSGADIVEVRRQTSDLESLFRGEK
jgi:ABC-2 type transport system ATP-binding protein